jgi:Xaa-Pro aminopeptidase
MVKSPAEVEELAFAGAAIDRVHARMGEWLRVGRTEWAVGARIEDIVVCTDDGVRTLNERPRGLAVLPG